MTTFQALDIALLSHGIRYDVASERFMHGNQQRSCDEVMGLVPGMTLDELTSYQDYKSDKPRLRKFVRIPDDSEA